MTRIGVMTFLHNDNYGSILQAWALQQTMKELGFEAEHIDYAPSKKEKLRNLLMSGNSPKLILEGIRKRSATSKPPAYDHQRALPRPGCPVPAGAGLRRSGLRFGSDLVAGVAESGVLPGLLG